MDVSINVDRFRRHPVREVVALLPNESDAIGACDELESAGLAVRDGAGAVTRLRTSAAERSSR
jgi:hypothetical protein